MPGQDAVAAIAEIVRTLEADPNTDRGKVDIERLRRIRSDTVRAAVSANGPIVEILQGDDRASLRAETVRRPLVVQRAVTVRPILPTVERHSRPPGKALGHTMPASRRGVTASSLCGSLPTPSVDPLLALGETAAPYVVDPYDSSIPSHSRCPHAPTRVTRLFQPVNYADSSTPACRANGLRSSRNLLQR
jgi:hypothetical protein